MQEWASKELANLNRMFFAGLNTPKTYMLKRNILAMQFIGKNGEAAPKLKDAVVGISQEEIDGLYFEAVMILKLIFAKCKLVHGDFSSYNLMVMDGKLVVFDVSQVFLINN